MLRSRTSFPPTGKDRQHRGHHFGEIVGPAPPLRGDGIGGDIFLRSGIDEII